MSNYDDFDRAEMTCGNCANWNRACMTKSGHAECNRDAIEPDAGTDARVFLSAKSHCRNHKDLWQPTVSFVYERTTPLPVYYGVTPGVHYPCTLAPWKTA